MKRFGLFLIPLSLFACKPAENEICEEELLPGSELVLDQIVGTWKNADGIHFERWKKTDSTHYSSDVYKLEGEDTIFLELAKIYYSDQKWNFENWVKDQNHNENVLFKAENWDKTQISFKNLQHDFPTEIRYYLVADSILKATIFGKNDNGNRDSIQFNYERLN